MFRRRRSIVQSVLDQDLHPAPAIEKLNVNGFIAVSSEMKSNHLIVCRLTKFEAGTLEGYPQIEIIPTCRPTVLRCDRAIVCLGVSHLKLISNSDTPENTRPTAIADVVCSSNFSH